MKRRLTVLILTILAAAALFAPAFADLMWEPNHNSFFERSRDDCVRENRSYLANGEKGYITLLSAPDSLLEVKNFANGVSIYVGYVWQGEDGTQWALGTRSVRTEKGWESYDGWLPMSELALIYDSLCFEEDYGDTFEPCTGSLAELGEVALYSYPGGVLQSSGLMDVREADWAEYDSVYTDENGLRWATVGYLYGFRNVWYCIDDPANEGLGIESAQAACVVRGESGLVPPTDLQTLVAPAQEVPGAKTWVVWCIPAALIVVVAVVTAVLIRRRTKKASAELRDEKAPGSR